ncbi:MAG: DapH/DapD/GlmU-related protein [Bacteroidota bacterium]
MSSSFTKIKRILINLVLTRPRVLKYWVLSTCNNVEGTPVKNGPVLFNGLGIISFEGVVQLGFVDSPLFFSSYSHFEARNIRSSIKIKSGVFINNNACIISEGEEGIVIGENTLAGTSLTIFDSDFHDLDPSRRTTGVPKTAGVRIGNNVFIGSNVTILKGVEIGDNTVIGSGSVVTRSIPGNVVAGGNPCRVIKSLTSLTHAS